MQIKFDKRRIFEWFRRLDTGGTTMELIAEWSPAIAIGVLLWLLQFQAASVKPYLDQFFFFFAITWLIGQWQRVRRERHRRHVATEAKEAAATAELRLQEIAERIEGYATGGESGLQLSADLQGAGDHVLIQAVKVGKFPVFDLDLQGIRLKGNHVNPASFSKRVDTFYDSLPLILARIELQAGATAVYVGTISTRNKNYIFHVSISSAQPCATQSQQRHFVALRYRDTSAVQWIYRVPNNFPEYDENRPSEIFSLAP